MDYCSFVNLNGILSYIYKTFSLEPTGIEPSTYKKNTKSWEFPFVSEQTEIPVVSKAKEIWLD